MDYIKTLTDLEPVFLEAGQLACKMQQGVKHHNKFNSGVGAIDIVTEADLAVQEFLLTALAKTDLVNCRLMAEEDTPQAAKFNPAGKFYLAIDPIDGTAFYAKGGGHFSVIVSLHDGKNLLYTFMHFPALSWTHRFVGNKYSATGKAPALDLPAMAKNSIVYYRGNPGQAVPALYKELAAKGLNFVAAPSLTNDYGISEMCFLGKVAGRYSEDINVYDGLVSLHYALAKGYKVYSGGPNGKLDLTDIRKRDIGLYYPGYYLVLLN